MGISVALERRRTNCGSTLADATLTPRAAIAGNPIHRVDLRPPKRVSRLQHARIERHLRATHSVDRVRIPDGVLMETNLQ
jgi:hypothetical protein